MKDFKVTVSSELVTVWVTIALVLAFLKLLTSVSLSWAWVLVALFMPVMIVIGVSVVLILSDEVSLAIRQARSKFRAEPNQQQSAQPHPDTSEDTNSH